MKDLVYQLSVLCKRNDDGKRSTSAQRQAILKLCGEQLSERYPRLTIDGIKGRHVHYLVEKWKSEGKQTGTLKNRLAALRWWCEQRKRLWVMSPDNADYGIGRRVNGVENKERNLTPDMLNRIGGPYAGYIRYSLKLQAAFGLRREEAMKFNPSFAIRRDESGRITHIDLKGSWCKNGRPRRVPVKTPEQAALLEEVQTFTGSGSLIPKDKRYVEHLQVWKYWTRVAGISRTHGLRHAYAQDLYEEVSGLRSPHHGGEKPRSIEEKARDHTGRLTVSEHLGHNRKEISTSYVGRVPRK